MSPRPGDLLVGSLLVLFHGCVAQLDSFIDVTSPESGDVFRAGDVVRVEWESPTDSSYFDVNLLNDGSPVDSFCDGGCLAPNGFLEVTLPTGLAAGSEYTFLVGDRVADTSVFGESEAFQIMAVAGSDGEADADADTGGDDDAEGQETAGGDGGDGDGFRWGIVIGAVAAGLGLATLCVVLVLACCRKGRGKGKSTVRAEGGGGIGGGGVGVSGGGGGGGGRDKDEPGGPTGVSGDVFASSGGASDGGASIAALAEMGALSPVQEENAEVVTKNPMISAMANGAQFHSSGGGSTRFNSNGGGGGSARFNSTGGGSTRFNSNGGGSARFNSSGGSSKFQSLGGGSSNEGEGSTRGPGDDDEESGGMFADADVVAALAAAAAHGVGKKGGMSIKRSGSGSTSSTPRWDGGWIKSPSWNRQKAAAQQSPSPMAAASRGEEKSAEAASVDSEPEAVTPAPSEDWMVSTRESFSSRKNAEAAAFMEALRMDAIASAREEKTGRAEARLTAAGGAPMEEKKAEESELAASPQSVDGISAKAFAQAEVVASKLPVVRGHGGVVVSEPECEVPKPALSSGSRPGSARKQGDYSWLLSSSSGSMDKAPRPVSPSGDSPPQAPYAKKTTSASAKAPSVLPNEPTSEVGAGAGAGAGAGSAPKHAGELGQDYLPPKSQGAAPARRTVLTPRGGGGAGTGTGRGFSGATSPSTTKPSWIGTGTPGRGPRVSQVVEVFEGLTPRGNKAGSAAGFSTPSRSTAAQARAAYTPGGSKAVRSALAPTSPLTVEGFSTPGPQKGAPTPGALTPGAVGWTTPVATPDRPLSATAAAADPARGAAAATGEAQSQSQEPKRAADPAAPEELSRVGAETPGGESSRGWSTPLATPDRSPRTSAPDSGRGGATPECTTEPVASRAAGKTGESPMDDEGRFAWQLESPAGVDGLPSPIGSSDIRVLAIGKKRGRIIPAILGASNTPVADGGGGGGTPVLTPGTADIKGPGHSVVSSGDSSAGAGAAWEMEPSFGASQVAAFVADAQAEAAAEAQALVVEAQAEAAEEEAAEEKAKSEAAARSPPSPPAEDRAGTSGPVPTLAAAAAAEAGRAEPPRVTADVAFVAPAPIAAPALATIAARLSPISAARSSALQTPLPTVGATSSPITAISPALMPVAEDQAGGKEVTKDPEGGRAPTTMVSKVENHEPVTVASATAPETLATQAASAEGAAATAAAEADAAKQRDAEKSTHLVMKQVGDVAAVEGSTAAGFAPKPAEAAAAAAGMGESDADTDAAKEDEDEGMGVVVYSADAAWREVYNDAEADTSDPDTDGDELIDVGEETDWSTAVSVIPAAYSGAANGNIGEATEEVPAETTAAAAAGEDQDAERTAVDSDEEGRANDGEGQGQVEGVGQEDEDSLQGEASGVDALVASAMALADAAENDAEGLGGPESYEGVGGEQFHTANTAASDKEYGSPLGSVRDVVTSGVFGSAKSLASNWNEGEETDGGGDAEREAEEVQALVAEALALVKEANEDA